MRKNIKLDLFAGVFTLALVGLVTACSQVRPTQLPEPIRRAEMVSNLDPVLQIEEQASKLMQEFRLLLLARRLEETDKKTLKLHHDVYYVYHAAAIGRLARGELDEYLQYVKLAQVELDAMKEILDLNKKKAVREWPFSETPRNNPPIPQYLPPSARGDNAAL